MKNTLFNEEIEKYTGRKYSLIKIGVLVVALFAAFTFIGWALTTLTNMVPFMDVFLDAQ